MKTNMDSDHDDFQHVNSVMRSFNNQYEKEIMAVSIVDRMQRDSTIVQKSCFYVDIEILSVLPGWSVLPARHLTHQLSFSCCLAAAGVLFAAAARSLRNVFCIPGCCFEFFSFVFCEGQITVFVAMPCVGFSGLS